MYARVAVSGRTGSSAPWSTKRRSPDFPLGDAVETLVRREDTTRFIEEVRGDEPDHAGKLRIEERETEVGELN